MQPMHFTVCGKHEFGFLLLLLEAWFKALGNDSDKESNLQLDLNMQTCKCRATANSSRIATQLFNSIFERGFGHMLVLLLLFFYL